MGAVACLDPSAMTFGNGKHPGEAKAGAGVPAGDEGVEDAVDELGRYTGTVVGEDQMHLRILQGHADVEPWLRGGQIQARRHLHLLHRLQGIEHEVEASLDHLLEVEMDFYAPALILDIDEDALTFDF